MQQKTYTDYDMTDYLWSSVVPAVSETTCAAILKKGPTTTTPPDITYDACQNLKKSKKLYSLTRSNLSNEYRNDVKNIYFLKCINLVNYAVGNMFLVAFVARLIWPPTKAAAAAAETRTIE